MADKTVEIDEQLQAEIAKSVADSLNLDEKIADAATKAAEAVIAKLDVPAKKAVEAEAEVIEGAAKTAALGEGVEKALVTRYFGGDDKLAGQFPEIVKSPFAQMSKERRLVLGVKALMNKDSETVKGLNDFAGALYAKNAVERGAIEMAEKAGYANDAVSGDGGALVPDPEFNTVVYENLPKYGVAFSDANVQTTDRTAVYALSLTGTIAFTNVAEGGVIAGTKLGFDRKSQALVKYAAIVPATEELTEDSAVDYWQIVTNEVARAYSKTADQIVFTDTTMGILHKAGIITSPLLSGGAGTTIAWDDLLNAEGKLEDGLDTSDFKWYMRKETFFRLAQIKSSSGGYLADSMMAGWNPNPNNPTTPWGTQIKFTRVLDRSVDASSNDGIAVYGNLRNYNLYNRNGMALTMLTEATITDASSSSFNLATQDGLAMRVVVRLLGILPTGNASKFVVVGTGTVS